MAKNKKYICSNFGNCDKANKKEKFEIPEGEDLKCPDCGMPVTEAKDGFPMWIVAVIAVAIIGIGAFIFWPKGGEKADTTGVDQIEEIDIDEEETEEPFDEGEDAVAVPDTVTLVVTDTVTITKTDTVTVEKPVIVRGSNELSNYNLGWGKYTGKAKNGKPDGFGEVTVTKSYSIDLKSGGKTLDVSSGDVIKNAKFSEGKLVSGTLVRTDKTTKSFSIGI